MRSPALVSACVVASLALHLAVLTLPMPFGLPQGTSVPAPAALVLLPPPAETAAATQAPLPANVPLAATEPLPRPSLTGTEAAPPAGLLPAPLDYLPRERLTAVARPLSEIYIPYPEGVPAPARLALPLTLLIDESGIVQQVELTSPRAPQAFEQAAVSSFLAARFKPGEVGSQAVRSQLRVEVRFETQSGSAGRSQASFTLAPTNP